VCCVCECVCVCFCVCKRERESVCVCEGGSEGVRDLVCATGTNSQLRGTVVFTEMRNI
jgi:hypothetical protein